jgi:DNA mismatch repair ATPase MutS
MEVARLAGLPSAVVANARDVLARLERYELEVFAEEDQIAAQRQRLSAENLQAASAAGASAGSSTSPHDDPTDTTHTVDALSSVANRAGRRKLAAQNSLFDLANQKVVEELKNTDLDKLSAEEAKELLRDLRKRAL